MQQAIGRHLRRGGHDKLRQVIGDIKRVEGLSTLQISGVTFAMIVLQKTTFDRVPSFIKGLPNSILQAVLRNL